MYYNFISNLKWGMNRAVLTALVLLIPDFIFAFQVTDNTGAVLNYSGKPGSPVFEKRYFTKNEGSKMLLGDFEETVIFAKGAVYKKNANIDLEKNLIVFVKNGRTLYWELYKMDSVLIGSSKIYPVVGHLSGCLIVYNERGFSLIIRKVAELKSSNYNAALDAGNRNNAWSVKDEYFVTTSKIQHYFQVDDGLVSIPPSKKKFAKLFSNPDSVLSFMKKEKKDIDKVEDLIIIFNQFSSELIQ